MPDIVTSKTFVDGERGITATKMNQIISGAVIQPAFYSAKPASATLDATDQLLELKASGAYATITGAQIISSVAGELTLADATQNGMLRQVSGLATDFVDGTNHCQDVATFFRNHPTAHYYDYDDFINSPPKFTALSSVGAASACIVYFNSVITDHPGFVQMQPGTVGTGYAQLSAYPIGLSTLPYTWRTVLQVGGTLGIHNVYAHFGFASAAGSLANLAKAIIFYFNPAVGPNWRYTSQVASGVATSGDTGIAVTSGAWVDLKIVVTQAQVLFYINQVLVGTVTTNIAAATVPFYPLMVIANNGDTSGAIVLNVDLVEIDLATPMTNRFSSI